MKRNPVPRVPAFAQATRPLEIIVEGVGDVIKNYYSPAFEKVLTAWQGKREIRVTFTDKSEYWSSDPSLALKMRTIIADLKKWGANYLDKSEPNDLAQYRLLTPDVVIIATPDFTHVEIAEEWLGRDSPPEQLFVEKPLAHTLNAARDLFGTTGANNNRILAYDHYRARLSPSREQMAALLNFWGKGVRRFTFYCLEDQSGGDPKSATKETVGRNGAIEIAQRVKALNQGLILDLMPHVIALLAHFARVDSLLVTRVKAAQYIGVDGDENKRTEIDRETFAEIGFECRDYAGNPIEGTVYLGKGVRGAINLGTEYDSNTKVLDIEGLNGNKTRFDLRKSGNGASCAHCIDKMGTPQFKFDLPAEPYQNFIEKVVDGTYLQDNLALNVEVGKRILEVMEDMRYPIPRKEQIPTYPSGMSGIRPAAYLEEILENLQPLYGR